MTQVLLKFKRDLSRSVGNKSQPRPFLYFRSFTSSPAKEESRWDAPLQRCGWADQDWENYCCTNTHLATTLKHHWAQQKNANTTFIFHSIPGWQDISKKPNIAIDRLPCFDQALLHSRRHFSDCIGDFISWCVRKTHIQETSVKQIFVCPW